MSTQKISKRKLNFLTPRVNLCVTSIDPEIRRILCIAIIRPDFEYIAPKITYQRKTIKLAIINLYKNLFKNVLCLPKSTKNDLLSHHICDREAYGLTKVHSFFHSLRGGGPHGWKRFRVKSDRHCVVVLRALLSVPFSDCFFFGNFYLSLFFLVFPVDSGRCSLGLRQDFQLLWVFLLPLISILLWRFGG